MGELSALPNLGKVVEKRLNEVNINTVEELMAAGSREAFLRLRSKDPGACINMLYGLEGAVSGIRWHHLEAETKRSLKQFYDSLQKI